MPEARKQLALRTSGPAQQVMELINNDDADLVGLQRRYQLVALGLAGLGGPKRQIERLTQRIVEGVLSQAGRRLNEQDRPGSTLILRRIDLERPANDLGFTDRRLAMNEEIERSGTGRRLHNIGNVGERLLGLRIRDEPICPGRVQPPAPFLR